MAKHLEAILYVEDGWTKEKILEIVGNRRMIKEYAIILHDKDVNEDQTLKKAHFHVYMNFGKSSATLGQTAKWFGIAENQVERIKTKKYFVLQYYLHTNSPEKYQYPIDDMICNFDLNAYFDSAENVMSLDRVLEDCANGTITQFNFLQYISPIMYAKHEVVIKRAWAFYEQKVLLEDCGKQCNVVWVWGASGCGKTTICHLYCKKKGMSVYQSASGADPLSNYAGQDALILDDIRARVPFSFNDLLRILDPHYGLLVHSRYKNKTLRCKVIFITSVFSPEETVKQFDLHEKESPVQLYRRLAEVWHLSEDRVDIFTYNLKKYKFEEKLDIPNPVPHYLKSLAEQTAVDGASVLSELVPTEVMASQVCIGKQQTLGNFDSDDEDSDDDVPF